MTVIHHTTDTTEQMLLDPGPAAPAVPTASWFADIHAGLDMLMVSPQQPVDMAADEWLHEIERLARRVDALGVRALGQVEADRSYLDCGHINAKGLARQACDVSAGEANRRSQVARMRVQLPEVAAAHDAGDLAVGNVTLFGRVHANPRVRALLPDSEQLLLRQAIAFPLPDFQRLIAEWERLADHDGTDRAAERSHRRRDFRMHNDFDGNWKLDGGMGSAQGAASFEVFQQFVDAEYRIDWDNARLIHGDDVCEAHLERTPQQRRADAFAKMCQQAVVANRSSTAEPEVVILIDQQSFEEQLARTAGHEVQADPADFLNRTCRTLRGNRIEPSDAVAAALIGSVRRAVIAANGVTINLGRKQRLFTGAARLAALLQSSTCAWPGCRRPVTGCEVDHRKPWAQGGRTDQQNARPLCGPHNRFKESGYFVTRASDGTYTLHRPDGS